MVEKISNNKLVLNIFLIAFLCASKNTFTYSIGKLNSEPSQKNIIDSDIFRNYINYYNFINHFTGL